MMIEFCSLTFKLLVVSVKLPHIEDVSLKLRERKIVLLNSALLLESMDH